MNRLSTVLTRTLVGLAALTASTAIAAPASAAPGGENPQGVDPARPPGAVASRAAAGPAISRGEIIQRAQTWVTAGVPYSQSAYRDGYRTDCSGFVSMAWRLNRNYWTGDLHTVGASIPFSSLRPGDMLLYHNPANPTNGSHVVLFDKWVGAVGGDFWIYEQTPPRAVHRKWSQTSGRTLSNYKPFRYTNVVDGPANLGVLDFHLSDNPASTVSTRPVFGYGNSPMLPIRGDWDGNGTDTVSAFDPTTATFLITNTPETGQATHVFRFGNPGQATPITGDWNGDGTDEVGVRMGNTFFLRTTAVTDPTEAATHIPFGDPGDHPAIGDWNGDGTDDMGIYRPSTGQFHLGTPGALTVRTYGNPGATPLTGDWNADGTDNIGVRMGITYFLRTSEISTPAETTSTVAYGNGSNEIPITGDWNGDHRDTHGIVF
jgi:hypothetical protein